MAQTSLYRIDIDAEWSLVDLYRFPHTYTHVYAFLYSLSQAQRLSREAVNAIYRRHPWRGGYSAVNFYGDLYFAMEETHRPMVNSMRYSSPGFIELAALVLVATQIEKIVATLAKCVDVADATYDRIYKRAKKRKLLALDVKRREREHSREEIEFMVESSKELARLLHLENLDQLQARTEDHLGTLKIMLSFYRRARELVDFQISGKVRFHEPPRQIVDEAKNSPPKDR
jgi:hypothetical protein